jgi:potassium/chloride transporter 9
LINLITTLSVSAISSNGIVRGGGAYYLISRSLGPEFGGSIGLVFYMGYVLNTGMNAVGMIDCIINNFGQDSGSMAQVMPESFVSSRVSLRMMVETYYRSGTGISMPLPSWCFVP